MTRGFESIFTPEQREAARKLEPEHLAQLPEALPPVLDACCGPRSMWFDRKDARCLFVDKRRETHEMRHSDSPRAPVVIDPDRLCDFTALPFSDDSFGLVVFDPPHVVRREALGNVTKFYGVLGTDWREMLQLGFSECFRVLAPGGVLIFKWTETQIPLREVLALTAERPLFGHKSGAKARTHWCAFMKDGWTPALNKSTDAEPC